MKKVFMFAAMLGCALSAFAEEKVIELTRDEQPKGRTLVQMPTATIDGVELDVNFNTSTSFDISVVDTTGTVVYTGSYQTQGTTIVLPGLPAGDYELVIEDTTHTYSGEFCIVY